MARKDGKDRGLFQRKDSPTWWIRWTCPSGHDHQEKIGPKSLARQVYQQRKVAAKVEGFCLTQYREQQRRTRAIRFAEVAQRYLTWSRENRPRSLGFRVTALHHLEATFGAQPLSAITRAAIEAYMRRRQQPGVRPATVNRERAVLSHLFTKARHWGLVEHNPVLGTEHLPECNERPRPLTSEEQAQVLSMLPTRHHALVHFALHTGLRLGELRAQCWADVDLGTSSLVVTRPKSGQHEVLPLNQVACNVLAGLSHEGELLFPQMPHKLSDLFIRSARKAGLSDVTFHCLRDTYISRLAPHCTTPTLMALARHRDYRTTRRYVQVDGAHLRHAVASLVTLEGENRDSNREERFEVS